MTISLIFWIILNPFPLTTPSSISSPLIKINSFFDKRQSTVTLPDCGQDCYALAIPSIGSCGETDTTCLCQDEIFLNSAEQCFQSACSSAELSMILSLGQKICQSLGTSFYRLPELGNENVVSIDPGTIITPTGLFSVVNTLTSSNTEAIPTLTSSTLAASSTSSISVSSAPVSVISGANKPSYTNQTINKLPIFSTSASNFSFYWFYSISLGWFLSHIIYTLFSN
ncbi:hypothetical protein CROQUDRAFT_668363 [Cronartium quercuum f. sp. fusiforme G11]|uniref:CFEM domain-containing protein n=1 Tax=Cronartium quercuum f. sp. fusiforme G11 TaxID=708437 RepID=A0A9P6NR92_9BASI|nr:hypothetical protein CROQUDRAFT_668363 [Cronartium quercuum f. sp. fusiforme G11]